MLKLYEEALEEEYKNYTTEVGYGCPARFLKTIGETKHSKELFRLREFNRSVINDYCSYYDCHYCKRNWFKDIKIIKNKKGNLEVFINEQR